MTTKTTTSKNQYTESVGRRKTAIARVRLSAGDGEVMINDIPVQKYFTLSKLAQKAVAALVEMKVKDKYQVSAHVKGGGINSQAEAVRLGIARALATKDDSMHKTLRIVGLLTRDARKVERKKYGLRKARRAPQWAKR